jgi:hypothetical protein
LSVFNGWHETNGARQPGQFQFGSFSSTREQIGDFDRLLFGNASPKFFLDTEKIMWLYRVTTKETGGQMGKISKVKNNNWWFPFYYFTGRSAHR